SIGVDALRVSGTVGVLGQAPARALVMFLPDAAGQNVAGLRVDVALLDGMELLPGEAAAVAQALGSRLPLGPAHLVFGLEPGAHAAARGPPARPGGRPVPPPRRPPPPPPTSGPTRRSRPDRRGGWSRTSPTCRSRA